jgi:hypothetical protein
MVNRYNDKNHKYPFKKIKKFEIGKKMEISIGNIAANFYGSGTEGNKTYYRKFIVS